MRLRVICAKLPKQDFIVTDQKTDFEGAHKICSELGLEIVRVDNIQDANDILVTVREKYRNVLTYWVDSIDRKKDGIWVHYDGTLAATDMWNPGQPDKGNDENCVYGGYKLLLRSARCSRKFNVICAKLPKQEFLITNLQSDFEGAHKICSSLGTEIVRVDNIDTAKDIHSEIKKKYPNGTGYWIDANDIKNKGVWVHYDGTPAAINMWHKGEPTQDILRNCVVGSRHMKDVEWSNDLCTEKMRVICSMIPKQDFIITNQTSKFEEAQKICSELGLEIVRVENTHVARDILAELNKLGIPYVRYWVDANDIDSEGTFVHYDGTLAVTNMWSPGQPYMFIDDNCVFVHFMFLWFVGHCSMRLRVICSKISKKES